MSRPTTLPGPLFELILDLIRRDDVQSVSCPLEDYALWRALVGEQVRRARLTGQHPQLAFGLRGPDSGLPEVDAEAWGGGIHIPYEGACDGDLFILPKWHRFFQEDAGSDGSLRRATRKCCHYVLMQADFGELACATRTVVGNTGWVFYQSNDPHRPCDHFW